MCCRQNPLPRKLSWLLYGELEGDEDPVPQAPNSVVLTGSLWKGIAGNDFTSDGDNLLITDLVFKTVRVVKNANKLWRDPQKVLHISTLRLIGNAEPLHPVSIRSGLPCYDNKSIYRIWQIYQKLWNQLPYTNEFNQNQS